MTAGPHSIGKLSVSLKVGESAIVQTPTGDVIVKCVRPNGANSLTIQIVAPRAFNIDRKAN